MLTTFPSSPVTRCLCCWVPLMIARPPDSPYLPPIKGTINDPINVVASCVAIAAARGGVESAAEVAAQVLRNFDSCVSRSRDFCC
jgi:hypothetical protein